MSPEGNPSAGLRPADNPFSLIPGAWAGSSQRPRSWRLPLINSIAAAAFIAAVGFRLWEAHLPASVVQQELILIAAGIVFAAVAVGVRATRLSNNLALQLVLMLVSAILTVLVLGVAGRSLGDDLPPLAAAAFATILLHFELGLHARHFASLFAIALAGLGALWIYAVTQLMVSFGAIAIWTLVLLGLGLLAFLVRRSLASDLSVQIDHQASLLLSISDLGEGLLITENGRYFASNDAYLKLTGYTPDELRAVPTMIELAPPDERETLANNLATRFAGGDAPVRYEAGLIAKDGRRLQVEVAIHPIAADGPRRLLALVSDITERHRATQAERESETRFRTLFEQAQAGMTFAGLDGRIIAVNPAYCELLGYAAEELKTMSVYDVTFAEDVDATKEAQRRMMAGEEASFRFEKRFLRKDGDQVWADVAVRLVREADGKPLYFQTVIIDIRDRKRNEVLQSARFAVTQALLTSPGWDKAAPHVLEGLCQALDFELAEYWEVDPQREAMHLFTSWKRPGRDTSAYEATAIDATFRRGDGLAGQVWESGAPITVTDVVADSSARSAAAVAAGLKGIVGFPVRSGRRVVGMISLHTWAPRPLDDGLIAVMNDIGSQIGEFVERKRAELALQESEKRMRSVLDNVSDGLATLDQTSVIESANPAVVKLFGYLEDELVGQPVDTLIATTHRSGFVNYLQRRLKLDLPASGAHETMGKRKNGSLFPLEFVVSSMHVGSRHLFIATMRDISERKAHTDALEYQALHDALTGLPNRSLFGDRLRQALLSARRNQRMFGVLLLDLDRFKDINDALGHDRGDSLLQEVTARLRGVLRATDTIARLGGDEFAVLTTDAKHPDDVVSTARKILAALEGPFAIGDQMVETGASIGIALYPVHGDDPGTLLRRADVAMYVAKRSGGGCSVYAPEQEAQSLRRSGLAGELRRSIPQGEMVLHYQPQVMLATGQVYSVEALVRWNHPREGLMPPDRFIPMTEETGVIHPLTAWALDSALTQLGKWLADGFDISVALNVSPRIIEDHSLEEMVAQALASTKVDPRRLTLEITEGVAMAAAAAKALQTLYDMGVRVSLDDFGTGYSSLLYLMRLPVNEIKIDRSFVASLGNDPDSGAIVRSAVGLGHNLGLRVVAEGLQDRLAEAVLVEAGCDAAQGFLFGRAVSDDEMTAQLKTNPGSKGAPIVPLATESTAAQSLPAS
ncbi:MAG TPA: PAS domain S-box protein [Candidatus Dormibacteraeota bacterium]|nr:PAS domain S-box protein [Candidatus Dormibacteraeota bacterium]